MLTSTTDPGGACPPSTDPRTAWAQMEPDGMCHVLFGPVQNLSGFGAEVTTLPRASPTAPSRSRASTGLLSMRSGTATRGAVVVGVDGWVG